MADASMTQKRWDLADLRAASLGRAAILCRPRHSALLGEVLPAVPRYGALAELPADLDTLVVVGGGALLDAAKLWRHDAAPHTVLVAVPTLWGSGAEASPVAIRTTASGKDIAMGPSYVPEVRVVWPELSETVAEHTARHACGDAWSHALEAFVSPLATPDVRRRCAALMNRMLAEPLGWSPRWLDLSAEACALQAESGVGLVHGFAHQLEVPLASAQPDAGWGHAKLCSIFLLPVMRFNQAHSPKLANYAAEFGLDLPAVWQVLERLFEPEAFAAAMQVAAERWMAVARDRCTRVNHVLVRSDALAYFVDFVRTEEAG